MNVEHPMSRKVPVRQRLSYLDLRLWLPLVMISLTLSLLALHQRAGVWCAVLVSAIFVAAMVRQLGVLSVLSVVILISALYGAAPAYDMILELGVSSIEEALYIDSFLPILLLYLSAIAFGFRQVNIAATRWPDSARTAQSRALSSADGRHRYVLLLVFSIAYFVISIDTYGLVRDGISRTDIYQKNNLTLQLIRAGIIYGAMYGFLGLREATTTSPDFWRNRLIWVIALSLYVYIELIIFGDRRILISAAIAMLVAMRPSKTTLTWMAVLGLPSIGFLWIFPFFRDLPVEAWPHQFGLIDWQLALNPTNGEFGAWTRIARDLLGAPFSEVQQFSLLTAPLSLIPSWIYPDRPLAPSLTYLQMFDPKTAAVGGGWGFALPVEAYLNGWYLGPVLFGLVIGALLGRVSIRGGMPQMLVLFMLCFSFRSDLVSLLQQGLLTAAFVVVYRPVKFLGTKR